MTLKMRRDKMRRNLRAFPTPSIEGMATRSTKESIVRGSVWRDVDNEEMGIAAVADFCTISIRSGNEGGILGRSSFHPKGSENKSKTADFGIEGCGRRRTWRLIVDRRLWMYLRKRNSISSDGELDGGASNSITEDVFEGSRKSKRSIIFIL